MDINCARRAAQRVHDRIQKGHTEEEAWKWYSSFDPRLEKHKDDILRETRKMVAASTPVNPMAKSQTHNDYGEIITGSYAGKKGTAVGVKGDKTLVDIGTGKNVEVPTIVFRRSSIPGGRTFKSSDETIGKLADISNSSRKLNKENQTSRSRQWAERYGKVGEDFRDNTLSPTGKIIKGTSRLKGGYNLGDSINSHTFTPEQVEGIKEDIVNQALQNNISTARALNVGKAVHDFFDPGNAKEKLDDHEINYLGEVFGPKFKQAMAKSSDQHVTLATVLGISRSLRTGFDMGGYRQVAGPLLKRIWTNRLGEISGATNRSIEAAKDWNAYVERLHTDKLTKQAMDDNVKLNFGDVDSTGEEMHGGKAVEDFADKMRKLPAGHPFQKVSNVADALVKSNHFHEALMNEFRLMIYHEHTQALESSGIKRGTEEGDKQYQMSGHLVNLLSGSFTSKQTDHSGIPETILGGLRDLMLAPRYRTSKYLTSDPIAAPIKALSTAVDVGQSIKSRKIVSRSPVLAKELLKNQAAIQGTALLAAVAFKMMHSVNKDVDFGTDPRDKRNYGKLRLGTKTFDFGGFGRVESLGMQTQLNVPNKSKSGIGAVDTATNRTVSALTGTRMQKKKIDATKMAVGDLRSGASPMGELLAMQFAGGRDFEGNAYGPGTLASIFKTIAVPIIAEQAGQSAVQGYKRGGVGRGAAEAAETAIPEFFGINVSDDADFNKPPKRL